MRIAKNKYGIQLGLTSKLCLVLHRIGRMCVLFRLRPLGCLFQMVNRIATGADIDLGADVSPETIIPHTVGLVIGATAIVEDNVVLMPHVVLGAMDSSAVGSRRHPYIQAGALIGAGAVVLGPVTIGRNARIGANAVVLSDVPCGITVVGVHKMTVSKQEKE